MTVIDLTSGSTSSWIQNTTPPDGGLDVSRVDDFIISFTRLLDSSCLRNEVFVLMDENGSYIPEAFLPIEASNDYSAVLQTLILHVNGALDPSKQYMLVIDGLYDAAGDSQDQVHTVQFITNDSIVDVVPDVAEVDYILVVDKTISPNADLVLVSSAGHKVYMNPADGAYNVARDTEDLILRFSPPDVDDDDASFSVRKRVISRFETPWSDTGATFLYENGVGTITLPLISTGTYVEPGYEYIVDVVNGTETQELRFMGELAPMLSSVQSVLLQAPGFSSYDIARMIYLNTAAVVEAVPVQESNPTKAGIEYVLYSTLWELATTGVTTSFVLGDLEVDKSSGAKHKMWERLMSEAWARLNKANPRFLVKGSANVSPHANRDWDTAPAVRRRTRGPIGGD